EVVCEVERDPVDAEPAKARLDLPPDPAAAESSVGSLGHRVEGLRRDHHVLAHRALLRPEPLADPRLAAPATVRVGGVERADTQLPRLVEEPKCVVAARPLSKE